LTRCYEYNLTENVINCYFDRPLDIIYDDPVSVVFVIGIMILIIILIYALKAGWME
jgi:hypothetical protein